MTILAFDLGKFNSVACVYSSTSGAAPGGPPAHRFQSLPTSPKAVHDLIAEVRPDHNATFKPRPKLEGIM